MQLKSLVNILSMVAVVIAQTPQDVETRLTALKTNVTVLDNAIKAFPDSGGSLTQAMAIHTDATNVLSATDVTTKSTVAISTPISETDGRNVINAVNAMLPIIKQTLSDIVKKKPAFDNLPLGKVSGIVKQDLEHLNTSTSNLGTALIARAPPDLVDKATSLANEIHTAFETAINAYVNA